MYTLPPCTPARCRPPRLARTPHPCPPRGGRGGGGRRGAWGRVAVDIGGYGVKQEPQTPKRPFDLADFPEPARPHRDRPKGAPRRLGASAPRT